MFVAFLSVSRIHSDRLCFFAFAAFVNTLRGQGTLAKQGLGLKLGHIGWS